FADWPGVSTDFGGVSPDADDVLSADQIDWADLIIAMEARHRVRLAERYGASLAGRSIVVLAIRDRYSFMDPALVTLLRDRVGPMLS
ncbi:MAG: phosphotyrosine protein phosphatase, partial [Pseudomonadota bacterium]